MNPSSSDKKTLKGTNPLYDAIRERRASHRPQPLNTVLYEVKPVDTLASIAARFNTTPSELVILNKLGCRTIFPSQIIYVPEVSIPSISNSLDDTNKSESLNGQQSPKPGHVQRIEATAETKPNESTEGKNNSPSTIAEDLNKDSLSKFLKINANHITDGEGVVSGVLLVTPNHLMFDPNVSDPLVIERGMEKYGVVAPIHMVVRAAIYTDIVRMRIKGIAQLRSEDSSLNLYHAKSNIMTKSSSTDDFALGSSSHENILAKDNNISLSHLSITKLSRISEQSFDKLDEEEDYNEHVGSAIKVQSLESQVEKSSSHSSLQDLVSDDPKGPCTEAKEGERHSSDEDIQSTSNRTIDKKKTTFEKTKDKFHKGILKATSHRRLSLPISTSLQELKSKVIPMSQPKKSKVKEEKPKAETPPTSYHNMVDEMPDLFAAVDKLMPRPAKSFNDNPLYLCLRMGQPMNMTIAARVTPIMSYGCKLKSEYWFSIPKAKVDNLYWFLLRWAPDRYGEVYDVDFDSLGFMPISEDDEEEELDSPPIPPAPRNRSASWAFPWRRRKSQDVSEKSLPVSWEFVDSEAEDKVSLPSVSSLPELLSPSDIFQVDHIEKINDHLPARAVGYAWSLIYSTSLHGFSLKSLYREMINHQSPVLIVINSTSGGVFGTMLSSPLKMSDHFYGTGESFLFTFWPQFKIFHWTGENAYFIKGNTASFAVGASDGQFGLWIDDDLYHGCTKACRTFANDPLCDQEDFIVNTLEAWGFV